MKGLFKRITASLIAAALTAGILPAAVMAADDGVYTLSNNYIKVDVSGKNGGFHIDTVQGDKLEKDDDNKMLLHNSDEYDTSFTSFRITKNGETNDYIFGRGYGFLGLSGTEITTVQEGDSRIVSTWKVEDIEITQSIELANAASAENGMVIISYTAKNTGDESADVKARIMLDTALGYQDYAYYKIPDNGTYVTVENERIIDGSSYGHMMFGYNDEFVPSVTAYTVNASVNAQECVPEQVAFGHWNNLAATVYDFTPNESLTFTNEYNAQYLTADSAYALYFGMGTIGVGESGSIATNYGVYSNAGTSQESKLAINISGAEPMTLNAGKTAYISPNAGDNEGELTLTANIRNFEKEGAAQIDNVRLVVYPDTMITPIDDSGSTVNGNGDTYSAENLYSVDFVDVQVDQTIIKDFRFKVPASENATYRKIELVAYEMDPDSELLMQESIIGRQSAYILCPGTDNGVPEVVLTGCTEYMYYSGKQRFCATGMNLSMLRDAGSYNFRLEQITESGSGGAVINIDSANASVDDVNNTIDINVPEVIDENTNAPKQWPLGTYRLVIDYTDDAMEDVVSDAAKVIVTNDPKYMNSGYGIVTVEQTVQPGENGDVAVCEYEVKTYQSEEDYSNYIEENPNAEVLVELKGDFSEERTDENGNAYYQSTVIVSGSEPVNPITLNQTMELRSGEMRVTVEKYDSDGNEQTQKILVDVDGDMRMAGTGTVIYDGGAALTEIANGRDYELRSYTTDGIRCSELNRTDPRFQNMANKETITYIFSKVFDTFVSIANIVNADLTFGELGKMVNDSNVELTKLVSFGAKIDLGVLVPKGSTEFKQNFDTAWKAYTKELKGAAWDVLNRRSPDTAALRSAWRDFKNSDYSTEYAARRSRGLIQACAEIEDILFGGGDFIGVSFAVDIGLPPLTAAMPGISGTLTVNTMGDWRFGVDGYAEFAGLTVEAKIEVIYSQELNAPIPNTLYLFLEFPPPGLNVDGFGVVWLRGGGGGIDNLYEAVYCPPTLPSTSIILSVSASIIQVLTAKINLEVSLTGLSIVAERATINETGIVVLRNSGIRFKWYPSFQFIGNVNVDLLGILNGSGYIVIDPEMSEYEFYAMVALMFPQYLPLVGGKTVASVGVGVNQDKIRGKATIIGLTFGILYYWGGDFSFVSGDGNGLEPSYPELMSEDDIAVAYDETIGRTLYAHVVPNYGLVKRADLMSEDGDVPSNSDTDVKLYSRADRLEHVLNLGSYKDDNGALNIIFSAESEEQAYELAGQIAIKGGDGNSYPITILAQDNANADTANAFVAYTPSEAADEPGEARLVVSFTESDSFNKDWTITTPTAASLEIYNVSSLPEFDLLSGRIEDGSAILDWTVNNGDISELEKITVYAVKDRDPSAMNGSMIGIITDEETLQSGTASLELPADMQTGDYYIRAVATLSDNLLDEVTTSQCYSFENPNQPESPLSVTAVNSGDYRLRVTPDDPEDECDGYQVNLYEVSTNDAGQTVYTELENISGVTFDACDEIIVGGRYDYMPADTEEGEADEDAPEFIGLEPGKTYAAGVRRVNYITDDGDNITASVMSEEIFSDGVVLSEPTPPTVSASVAAADGTAAIEIETGNIGGTAVTAPAVGSRDVNVTLTSDMPVSGSWYLDNISYEEARSAAEQSGAQNTYGELTTGEGSTAVIALTDLDTQGHTLHIEGANAGGDGFMQTVNFVVDTDAPVLAINAPYSSSLTENDKITITGRTDADAKLKIEVNGKTIGEKLPSEWDPSSENGSFSFTTDADKGIMDNKVVITASDSIGNTEQRRFTVVNERMSKLSEVRLYFNGTDVTNTRIDSGEAASGSLELMGMTSDNQTFVINDDSNIEWNIYAVEGSGRIAEEGEELSLFNADGSSSGSATLSFDKSSSGMVSGMFRLTETAGLSAAASYGTSGTHQVTFDMPEHGHLTVEPSNASAGDTVTVTIVPDSGYVFKGWSSNSDNVTFEDSSASSTTFVMPDGDVHITASLENTNSTPAPTSRPSSGGSAGPRPVATPTASPEPEASEEPTASPSPDPGTEEPVWFEDVPEDMWYYDPIRYAFENGLMNGVSETLFAPESDITRAMFVTVLHRMEGEPEAETEYTFGDVSAEAYYSEAVAWASENGIVEGFSAEEFGPDLSITREQMAAIIYRYARYKSYDLTAAELPDYSDAESISEYAREAVAWAADNGVMNGNDDNTFAPLANTTRAQAAAVFGRIRENLGSIGYSQS